MPCRPLGLLVLSCALLLAAPAAGAPAPVASLGTDTVLAPVANDAPLTAYGGWVVCGVS